MAKAEDKLNRDESPGIKPVIKETKASEGKISKILAPGAVLVGEGDAARVVSVPVNRHELHKVGETIPFKELRHGDELVGHAWREK